MDPVLLIGLIVLAMVAGLIGSVFGLGGGIIVVPVLTILYGFGVHDAVAVSLVAIASISSSSASSLIRKGAVNVRIGLRLEVAAAAGAAVGALIAVIFAESWMLALCFAAVLIYSAAYMFSRPERVISPGSDVDDHDNVYRDPKTGEEIAYCVRNMRTGMIGFAAAGISSALTGVGGGTIKIPVMNVHMHMPMKVATATSSYVIGITAFSGAAVYMLSGAVDILTASIVVFGAFIGTRIGLWILSGIDASSLRRYFSIVLIFLASVMILNTGGIL
jgi:uncharacterized membrane protein YfcA